MTATAASPGAALASLDAAPINIRHVIGFAAMVLGQFMAILDIQIVSASLTNIQAGLAASADEITWVQTSYLIAEVIMIPFSGFLSRMWSTRVVFVVSAAGFTLASAWAGFAGSMNEMILARVVQGFIGGAMIPTVFATAFTVFPAAVRDKTMVIMGLIVTLAPTIGPTLGGYLTEWLNWRWLFLINIVPGIAVVFLVWRFGDFDKGNPALAKGFDFAGLVLMALFLGGLEYALEEGPRNDWLDDRNVAWAVAVTIISGVLFFWRMLTYFNPIVDLRALANRNFAVGSGLQLVLGIGLYGSTFLVPQYLSIVRHLDAIQIGEAMAIAGISMFLMAPVSGRLMSIVDPRLQIGFGCLIAGLGFYDATGVTKDWDFQELIYPQVLRSVGLMLVFPPLTRMALGTLAPDQLKSASGLFNLMRNLGGAIGLAGLNTLLTDRGHFHWSRIAEKVNPARPEVQAYLDRLTERAGSLAGIDADAYAARQLANMVLREASVKSFSDAFLAIALSFFLIVVLLVFVAKPGLRIGPAPDAH